MSVDLPSQHPHEPVVSCDTALSCLVRLGICRGDDPEVEALTRHAVRDANTLPASRLTELVGKFGFQAEHKSLDWTGLTRAGLDHPILVFLKNSNVVLVTGMDGAAADTVSVWDPLHSDREALTIRREDFERAWSGDVLAIAQHPAAEAEVLPVSSGEQNVEILNLPEHAVEHASTAEPEPPTAPVPDARRMTSRRLVAIGLATAAGIGAALWIYVVADNVVGTGTQAKGGIPEALQSIPSTREATAHSTALAASDATGPTPSVTQRLSVPASSEPSGGPGAAVVPGATAPLPEPAPAEPTTEPAVTAAPVTATPSVTIAAASPHADPFPVEGRLSAAETAALLARGDALFSTGDLAAARLFYERAADGGEAQAAVRLGETYDPIFLEHSHLRGVHGNPETALSWYRRARDLGAPEAEVLLNSLQVK